MVVAHTGRLVGDFGGFGQRLNALPVVQVVHRLVDMKLTSEQAALLLALARQRVLAQPVA